MTVVEKAFGFLAADFAELASAMVFTVSGGRSAMRFVEMAKQWAELGANCIGGCCRTTPSTIAALKAAFDEILASMEGTQGAVPCSMHSQLTSNSSGNRELSLNRFFLQRTLCVSQTFALVT